MAVQTYAPFGFGGAPAQKKLDLSQVAPMPINPGMTGQQAILSRLQPSLDRQRTSLETQLTNQGLTPGTEAWTNAFTDFGNQENDARQQAILQGLNLDTQANQQGFNQAQAQGEFFNQGTGQDFSQNLEGQGQAFNQNLAGQQFGYQQFADQRGIDAAQHNSTLQGLFGLGANIGAPILSKVLGFGGSGGTFGLGGGSGGGVQQIGTDLGGYTRQAIDTGAGGGGGTVGNTAVNNSLKTGLATVGGKVSGALQGVGHAAKALMTNPWTAVAGGAILAAIAWTKSQAHWEANTWTKGFQKPFDDQMAQVHEQVNQLKASGQYTPEVAQQIQASAKEALDGYQQQLDKFYREKGTKSDQARVASQAYQDFQKYYGPGGQKFLGFLNA